MDIQTLAIAGQQYSNLKNYTDGAIQQAVVQSKETLFKKVTTLPDVNTAELGTIYYVPVEGAEENSNMCDEYAVFVNGSTRRWEKIGRTGSLPTALSQLTNDANYVQDATYIHTDNNYTTTEKNKLAGIAAGAEVNVQANWNETDANSDAYIQNKPSIYTQTEIDNLITSTHPRTLYTPPAPVQGEDYAIVDFRTLTNTGIVYETTAPFILANTLTQGTDDQLLLHTGAIFSISGYNTSDGYSQIVIFDDEGIFSFISSLPNWQLGYCINASDFLNTMPILRLPYTTTHSGNQTTYTADISNLDDGSYCVDQGPIEITGWLNAPTGLHYFISYGTLVHKHHGALVIGNDLFTDNDYSTKTQAYAQLTDIPDIVQQTGYLQNAVMSQNATTIAINNATTNIPKTALAQGVQNSLALADSALQQHQSLANYYTKTETDTLLDGKGTYSKPSNGIPATDLTSDIQTKLNLANAAVQDNAYVHTDNNYTNAEKTKLAGIAAGAEVNVQADWTEADSTSDAYIQNKPSLATVATSGSYADLANTPSIPANVSDLTNDLNFASGTYSKPNGGIPKSDLTSAVQGSLDLADTAVQPAALSSETSTRQTEDGKLQAQINAINARADVVDVVGTYSALQSYITSNLTDQDIVKVLNDENQSNTTGYYRWVMTNDVGTWNYIGSEGAFYTKAEADALLADKVDTEDLSTVATSGAYADLSGTPTLATIATSGNYSDLTLPQTGIPTSDLASGAQTSLGLADTAVQPSDLATIATTGDYSDLTLPQTGIPKTDLASGVQTSLEKADSAVQDANYVHTDNNYTTTEKTKLSGIAEGAEVNVQADWNVTDNTSDAYIQNKPLVDSTLNVSSTNAVQNGVVTTELNKKYVKPATGIPVSDLSSEAQNILTAADNVEISATTTQNGISVTVTDSTGTDTTVYVTNGEKGDRGEPFAIYTTYPTIAAMNADLANVPEGKFVMIAAVDNNGNPDPENADNSKLYVKADNAFSFITDLSGEQGIQGVAGGHFTPSVSSAGDLTWTYNSNASNNTTPPALVNIKGPQGETYELTTQDKDDIAAIALEIEYSEKQLYFENTSIAAADWEQTFTYEGYSYSVDLELPGLTESMIPEVYFSGSAILQFNYFPLANIHEITKDNETKVVLTIYAAQPEAVIIPTIKCEMTDYEELSIANGGNS